MIQKKIVEVTATIYWCVPLIYDDEVHDPLNLAQYAVLTMSIEEEGITNVYGKSAFDPTDDQVQNDEWIPVEDILDLAGPEDIDQFTIERRTQMEYLFGPEPEPDPDPTPDGGDDTEPGN